VPLGTIVSDRDRGEPLGDLTTPGQRLLVARGARGGRGNARFVSSTNRAPRRADLGRAGEERWIHLELKLLADVGVVGFPNAGKSTLVSRLSAATPKIADYPFTTLVPALGIVRVDEHSTFVIADLPGLIAGAAQGKGLGHRFLRHTERTRLLVHLVDLDPMNGREPIQDWQTIQDELAAYSDDLAGRPQIVAANKSELPGTEERRRAIEDFCACPRIVLPRDLRGDRPRALGAGARHCRPPGKRAMGRSRALIGARRIVVKVGSGLITAPGEGPVAPRISHSPPTSPRSSRTGARSPSCPPAPLRRGMARLGLPARPRSIPEKQAAAAVGQSALMWQYEQAFKRHGIQVGQVLLTREDIGDRSRYLNARNTLLALLDFGVLPIINENDTVAVDEIKVGDNDNLAALVAHLIDADLLVLLTDVDGLYTGDPRRDPTARRLETVEAVTEDIQRLVFDTATACPSGG
jgi:hypothetical protein